MIGRDVIVDALRITAVQNKIEIAANFYGKLKTFAQMFAIILIFFIFRLTPKINIV
jgi:CDP-diacylglycerol--glycerol-3-phosphate 3-phosphatidyltransferase